MPRANRTLGAAWVVFATANLVLMFLLPGEETIPYHLIWVSFAALYGLTTWPARATWTAFFAITVGTGVALVRHAHAGIIGWEECSEVVLMGAIAAVLVAHVNRHRAAVARIDELRASDHVRAVQRELATRFGSHELRTRLTVARGLIDLVRETTLSGQIEDDAALALVELDKASALATNLMTLVAVDSSLPAEKLDLDALIEAALRRWRPRADRCWQGTSLAGHVYANPERVEAALDCLIENAVKFTQDADRIAVVSVLDGADVVITVTDSGMGIPAAEVGHVTEVFRTGKDAGERAGSGLGLAIVRAVVEAQGGAVLIDSRLGGGTDVVIRMPHGRGTEVDDGLTDRPSAQPISAVAHRLTSPPPQPESVDR